MDITKLSGQGAAKDVTTTLASGSLTISKALVYRAGSEIIVELQYSNSTKGYIKIKQGRVKIGGDNSFETGTEVLWQD